MSMFINVFPSVFALRHIRFSLHRLVTRVSGRCLCRLNDKQPHISWVENSPNYFEWRYRIHYATAEKKIHVTHVLTYFFVYSTKYSSVFSSCFWCVRVFATTCPDQSTPYSTTNPCQNCVTNFYSSSHFPLVASALEFPHYHLQPCRW